MPKLTFIIGALILCAGGCKSERAIEQIVRSESPSATVSARVLLDAYIANLIRADEKYKGRIIEVTGAVGNTGVEFPNTPYVMLNASDIGTGVQCFFSQEHKKAINALQAGMHVTIRGRCEGFNQGVRVEGCILE